MEGKSRSKTSLQCNDGVNAPAFGQEIKSMVCFCFIFALVDSSLNMHGMVSHIFISLHALLNIKYVSDTCSVRKLPQQLHHYTVPFRTITCNVF